MIHRKSRDEIKRIRHAGHIVALVHQKMREVIEPGISTKELDSIAHDIIRKERAIPTFLGYHGFPGSICASINEQVVHGIPHEDVKVKEGDIIEIAFGNKSVKVEVLDVQETVRKEEAKELYRYI